MALVFKKFGSFVTQLYRGDYYCASLFFRFRGLFIRGLPGSNVPRIKGNDTRLKEKNVDSQDKKEKINTEEEQVFQASTVVRTRQPKPPKPSEGSGGQIH